MSGQIYEAVLATNDLQIDLTVKGNNGEKESHYIYKVSGFEQAYRVANSLNNPKDENKDIDMPGFVKFLLDVINYIDRYLGYRDPVPNKIGTFSGCISDKSGGTFYQFEYAVKEVLNNED
ncbi:hypothetical protein MCP_1419 [Methanocella paludicola SANAE]|uniref:Uncharacterized protein n=1 Tax=Methanocella paludicola (strain DSM 17711 / JCM 13418 / NBRC 101707 / SANAE) TaxID=304371 RepID=D1YYG9_METPS|nr:hypothetical protein [Methanocella paludicola]BAI61491.1 hypothetical protein MCP_1419 [Methanocella paludicola SANAE]